LRGNGTPKYPMETQDGSFPKKQGRPHIHDYSGLGAHLKVAGLTLGCKDANGQDHVTMTSGGSGGGDNPVYILAAFKALEEMKADPAGTGAVAEDAAECQDFMEKRYKPYWEEYTRSKGARVEAPTLVENSDPDLEDVAAVADMFNENSVKSVLRDAYKDGLSVEEKTLFDTARGTKVSSAEESVLIPGGFLDKSVPAVIKVFNKYKAEKRASWKLLSTSDEGLEAARWVAEQSAQKMKNALTENPDKSGEFFLDSQAANIDNLDTYAENIAEFLIKKLLM